MANLDLAMCIDSLVPAAEYGGSVTGNTQAEYEALDWTDSRPKPAWDDILAEGEKPALPTEEDIKSHAGERINAVYPAYKQRNMIARSEELGRIQRGEVPILSEGNAYHDPRPLTADEVVEEHAIEAAWQWIKAVRAACDALIANPVEDFTDDSHWPSPPVD